MNYRMMGRINALILAAEAVFMIPPLVLALVDGVYGTFRGFLYGILILLAVSGVLFLLSRGAQKGFYAREGLICVGVCWVIMSLLGCLPFWLSGEIPHYVDALFEMVSGFTTTGATIVGDVEALSRAALYWRSFSHWVGGMGGACVSACRHSCGRSEQGIYHASDARGEPGTGCRQIGS